MNSLIETRRGISAPILIDQVLNTVPYLREHPSRCEPIQLLKEVLASPVDLDHASYFALCLSAHFATVASFVPTDVDNQIRYKLWAPGLPFDILRTMARLTLEMKRWDAREVSARVVTVPGRPEWGGLSGHDGEWFSVAIGAYGALRRRDPDLARQVALAIEGEITREKEIFLALRQARRGIDALRAATVIAHNLGDLDRVIEMWNLAEDPWAKSVYKLGHSGSQDRALLHAGELNKKFMTADNHRHFALRKPRSLRRHPDLLLPISPFLDGWGLQVARHPGLSMEEVGEIAEALVDGSRKLPDMIGYARALAGILESLPGGMRELEKHLPAKISRELRTGTLRSRIAESRDRFEERWNAFGLTMAS